MSELTARKLESLQSTAIVNQNEIIDGMTKAAARGWAFVPGAISQPIREALEEEVDRLDLEEGDHIAAPINKGAPSEVRQLHARSYHEINDSRVIVAKTLRDALVSCAHVCSFLRHIRDLEEWMPSEAGYQLYRDTSDFISPHRDRRNDQILGATLTINGSAEVAIHRAVGHSDDYSQLEEVERVTTSPGDLMLLRAPGLGNGEQMIHSVDPPRVGSRLILNLRMRPNVLTQPSGVVNNAQ